MKLMAKLESFRHWIDGRDINDVVDGINIKARPRRIAEEFLVKVAREIGALLGYEAFTPPGGPTFIPGEFIVFLSMEDDKEWQGNKRHGLVQGLANMLSQRSRELFGKSRLSNTEFAIELRVDGTLEKGQFRIKAIWDSETSKTFVASRKLGEQSAFGSEIRPEDELTVVNPRPCIVLYSLEVMRGGERQAILPVTKPEITIGRGSQSIEVDIPIKGDSEVSRLHAVLTRDVQGLYWLTAKGQNPIFINSEVLQSGGLRQITPDDQINICSFGLHIKVIAGALV
jgi:hypothetical protein